MVILEGEQYFSLQEIADIKHVSINTVKSATTRKQMPVRVERSLGRLRLVRLADLENWAPESHGGRRAKAGRKPSSNHLEIGEAPSRQETV
ncbi:MAG: hypothetical protein EOO88_41990 [Pedobacter sp.]|nr:MAG: hypothetical protein EOO88_41990 [Pedobacter sp.]